MTAEVLFCGGERHTIEVVAGTANEITTAGRFNSTYARCAMDVATGPIRVRLYSGTSLTTVVDGETFYFRYDVYFQVASFSSTLWQIMDSSGFPWLRLTCNSSEILTLQYNSGTGGSPVWTTVEAAVAAISTGLQTWNIIVTIDTSGTHTAIFTIGGSEFLSGTFSQSLFTNIDHVLLYSNSTASLPTSQILATRGLSTIGGQVKVIAATAAGATGTFASGAFTDVNEAVINDATIMSSDTAGQKFTHAFGDVTVPTGFYVPSVWSWARAKNTGVAPNNLNAVVRRAGTDYATGNLANMSVTYGNCFNRWDGDPSGGGWTETNINGAEFGLESAA